MTAALESPADEYDRWLETRRATVRHRLWALAALFLLPQFAATALLFCAIRENDLDLLVWSAVVFACSAPIAVASAAVAALNWGVRTRGLLGLGFGPWALLAVEVTAIALFNI